MPPKKSGPTRPKPAEPDKRWMLAATYDGERYELPLLVTEVPIHIDRELDLQSRSGGEGLALIDVLAAIQSGRVQRHHVVAFLFAARRYRGESASYTQIEATYKMGKLDAGFEIVAEGDSPEAPGVN